MAEVTYYVALPFVASDDGIAAGEPVECLNSNAAVMRAELPLTSANAAAGFMKPIERTGFGLLTASRLSARLHSCGSSAPRNVRFDTALSLSNSDEERDCLKANACSLIFARDPGSEDSVGS